MLAEGAHCALQSWHAEWLLRQHHVMLAVLQMYCAHVPPQQVLVSRIQLSLKHRMSDNWAADICMCACPRVLVSVSAPIEMHFIPIIIMTCMCASELSVMLKRSALQVPTQLLPHMLLDGAAAAAQRRQALAPAVAAVDLPVVLDTAAVAEGPWLGTWVHTSAARPRCDPSWKS